MCNSLEVTKNFVMEVLYFQHVGWFKPISSTFIKPLRWYLSFVSCCKYTALVTDLKQWTMASNQGKAVISSTDFLCSLINYFWCFSVACSWLFLLLGRVRVDTKGGQGLLSCQMSFKMISCSKPLFSCPLHGTSHLVMFIFL